MGQLTLHKGSEGRMCVVELAVFTAALRGQIQLIVSQRDDDTVNMCAP